ncbi:hypothetical protein QTP70_009424 [Hemibagrus guttatus]|uniref:Gap junction protein n=1 Tax=Hemibagrus guttatus TaxID=175788 RepID=A0AAE0Q9Y4_9TELE|nr:hypothetical protein QTP70_009424 [Hemibagrus guttatus]
MDQLSEEVRQESPWTMMFADDIVICSESREQLEENLEKWRFALERRGMKVSRNKTEYMCVNEREGSGTVRLQGEEVKKVQEFKYLGSTVQSNGECGKEVKKRVQAGWNGWRKVSGVLCDRKISARIKGKVYRTVVRAAMLYGLETVSLRKRQESELEVAELKMLRFSLGVTRLDRIRNEYIRGTAHVGRLGDKVREARLRWFGHVQRREMQSHSTNIGKVWLTVLLIFRIMVLGGIDKVWGDEQSNMVCNVMTPGCKNVCYDNKFPISHSRFWVLQIIFVTLPTLVYLGYTLHVIHKEDKLREKFAAKQGTKLPKYTDANGKLQYTGTLLRIYVSCLLMTILFEAGFICAQYYLYGFVMDSRVICEKDPCPHPIECFISRPTEKTIFILFMLVTNMNRLF